MLYKITTNELWEKSQQGDRLLTAAGDDAFIHLAEEHNVMRIRHKFFPADQTVVILLLDREKLVGRLVKEKNPGGSSEYYHLYDGYIPLDAVVEVRRD